MRGLKMLDAFKKGYEFFKDNAGTFVGTLSMEGLDEYINELADKNKMIESAVEELKHNMKKFVGSNKELNYLQGNIAEFWHSGTFNIDAIRSASQHRTIVPETNKYASPDIKSNFGEVWGLKYYKNGKASAEAQSRNHVQNNHGCANIDDFLSKRGLEGVDPNKPVYEGQIRVIPSDQIESAQQLLNKMIATESTRRPDQVYRYQDTLDNLCDRLKDSVGNESVPLTRSESEAIAKLVRDGNFTEEELKKINKDFEIIFKYESPSVQYLIGEALKGGVNAAVISMVLKTAPEVYKAISYLIKTGEIDEMQFKKAGLAAVSGAAEGFIRGAISASIVAVCKTGILGEALKSVNPSIVGAVTVIAISTLKDAYSVAVGNKTEREFAQNIIDNVYLSGWSILGGAAGQAIIAVPVLGYMIGSFVGTVIGSFIQDVGKNAVLSFAADTGVTVFGLVDQDYTLPEKIIEEMGIETFEYETMKYDSFEPETFEIEAFSFDSFEVESLGIKFLHRGVIGVSKIGYVINA